MIEAFEELGAAVSEEHLHVHHVLLVVEEQEFERLPTAAPVLVPEPHRVKPAQPLRLRDAPDSELRLDLFSPPVSPIRRSRWQRSTCS